MIHLDTSFLIRALDPGSPEDRKLRGWIGEGKTLGMSTAAWTELLCGPLDRSELEWAAEIVGQRQDFTPEPGSLGRPARCPESLRARERVPGELSHRHDVPSAGRFPHHQTPQ